MSISYFTESIRFKIRQKKKITSWLQAVIQQEGYKLSCLNIIFCSDNYLHQTNKSYLGHNTLTDVITFNYATMAQFIYGDIYISIERVKENAQCFQKSFVEELYTIMVHGLLHLLSYDDQTIEEKNIMRSKEFLYIKQLLPI